MKISKSLCCLGVAYLTMIGSADVVLADKADFQDQEDHYLKTDKAERADALAPEHKTDCGCALCQTGCRL